MVHYFDLNEKAVHDFDLNKFYVAEGEHHPDPAESDFRHVENHASKVLLEIFKIGVKVLFIFLTPMHFPCTTKVIFLQSYYEEINFSTSTI